MSEFKVINNQKSICAHLRSKGMYVNNCLEPVDGNTGYGDGYFWCEKSLHQFGPDHEVVNRDQCCEGRTCFEEL